MSDQDPCGHEQPADIESLPPLASLTRTWVEAQANEAEEGYDVSQLVPRNVGPSVHHVHDTENVNSTET